MLDMRSSRGSVTLASTDKLESKDDHILCILDGLGYKYQSMIFVISTRTDSPLLQDVIGLLRTQESNNENKINVESSLPTMKLVPNHLKRKRNCLSK